MSKAQKISTLETLLARIRSRAAEPRKPPSPPAVAEAHYVPAVVAEAGVSEAETADARATDLVLEVEVQQVTVDAVFGAPVEEPTATEAALGSRERLVAAQPIAAEAIELAAVGISASPAAEEAGRELLADESDVVGEAEGRVEEAPLSSRRPVGPEPEEQLAEMAFGAAGEGEEEPPIHTPPPESGRLLAVPAELDFDADVTGVREAPAVAPAHARGDDTSLPQVIPTGAARELRPEVMRPQLPSGEGVVDVIARAQDFRPETFLALLDASVAL